MPSHQPLPPTGAQLEIAAGDVTATVTEVGAGLRAFASAGLPYVETFPVDRRPPRGAGTVLVYGLRPAVVLTVAYLAVLANERAARRLDRPPGE